MKPVQVTIDVPHPPEFVFDFLDVLANHEPFTNHMLQDWRYAGPQRGIGSKATVTVTAAGRSEDAEIKVIAAEPPKTIVEQNVSGGGRRIGTGTYTLDPLADGNTRIAFEYTWKQPAQRPRHRPTDPFDSAPRKPPRRTFTSTPLPIPRWRLKSAHSRFSLPTPFTGR